MTEQFLPVSKQDMMDRGWEQADFIIVTGDAYVDHPSFAHALLGRLLESRGWKAAILAQPDWRNADSFRALGRPRLAFLVASGNIDSMVNNYTASKKRRHDDVFSPGGNAGYRPDRAAIVYCNKIREAFQDVPVVIGGIEASLRRFAHYDYWDDKVRRSILLDSQADLLVYGMGERQLIDIAEALESGMDIKDVTYVPGTAYYTDSLENVYDYKIIPGFEEVSRDKVKYAKAFLTQYREQDSISGIRLVQHHGKGFVVQNPPAAPLNQRELDRIYSLPFAREYHPSYQAQGGVPAIEEVKFSITSSRGCFGNCSFCALTYHQGRVVQGRSHASILTEAEQMTHCPDFKGYIHDVGGPTANFRRPACEKQIKAGVCKDRSCLFPEPCKQLVVDHRDYVNLLRKLRNIPSIKKVFIRSGIRYDYMIADPDDSAFREIVEHHISGQLKVAPEHISDKVLNRMGKPKRAVYEKFVRKYYELNRELKKEQYLVPYLMSSHPGSDLDAAIELAEYLRDIGHQPQQVQDFYPTPGTLSTCMFYTGLDPLTMEKVYVPKTQKEKSMQRALLQYKNPKNYWLVYEALQQANRQDLIGFDKKCLIRPPSGTRENRTTGTKGKQTDSWKPGNKLDKGKGSSYKRSEKQNAASKGNSNPVKSKSRNAEGNYSKKAGKRTPAGNKK
jgi:uncharacterized radical SAM protein YgiQ